MKVGMSRAQRMAMCQFLEAHGVSPGDVLLSATVEVIAGKVHIPVIARHGTGEPMEGPGGQLVQEVLIVDQVCPFP